MSVLTLIAGIPLYSTVQEAAAWAGANGVSGFHTHGWQGQTGYMGGSSHSAAVQAIAPAVVQAIVPTPTSTPTTPTSTTTTTGGGGGTGGRGGY